MKSKQEGQVPELSYLVADFAPTLKGSVLSQSPALGSCILTALKGIFRPMRLWQKEPGVLKRAAEQEVAVLHSHRYMCPLDVLSGTG